MDEIPEIPAPKRRGWPKGKPRGPRKAVPAPMQAPAPEPEAPIHVVVELKNGVRNEFGAATHSVDGNFHVFAYPAEKDRYRQTKRYYAMSEIVSLEITEPRQTYDYTARREETVAPILVPPVPPVVRGPVISSPRKSAASILEALETSNGPIKMDELPAGMTMGNHGG